MFSVGSGLVQRGSVKRMSLNFFIGVITAVVCTLGGYVGAGGHLSVLVDAAPLEIVIMGGTAAGGFIISNPKDSDSGNL